MDDNSTTEPQKQVAAVRAAGGSRSSSIQEPPSAAAALPRRESVGSLRSSNGSYAYSDNDEEEDEYSYNSNDNEEYDVEGATMSMIPPKQKPLGSSSHNNDREISHISEGGYRFWSKAQVQKFMTQSVNETSELLCISPEAAVVLLRRYKWDGKRLVCDYFSEQQEAILKECGVWNRCHNGSNTGKQKSTGCCAICFDDDLEPNELFGMACGHEFCKTCWSGYLSEAVSQGPQCVHTPCPDPKCTEVVTQTEMELLAPPDAASKFQEFQLRSYIQTNWLMRWCPGAACDFVAVGSSADGLVGEGECRCGTRFCLKCGEMRHVPATCDMMILWKEKCHDESETANWILAKTKKCPKCDTRIDKNGGCNHMTCRLVWIV